jgi:hypothetical protein
MAHSGQENEEGTAPPERLPRTAMLFLATVIDPKGFHIGARVRNISSQGMGGISNSPLSNEMVLEIFLPGFEAPVVGQIAWADGKSFGLAFHEPIDLTTIAVKKAEPASAFQISDIHRPSDDCWRPGVISR